MPLISPTSSRTPPARPAPARSLAPLLLGVVLGSALQLRQPGLWSTPAYAIAAAAGGALALAGAHAAGRWRRVAPWALCLAAALAVFALCGLRAVHHARSALPAALEGQDVRVVGTVAGLPESSVVGLRFRFQVDSASRAGEGVSVPPLIDLAWYHEAGAGGSDPPPQPARMPHAGERWSLLVRLKAPHGARNPHGFDYELRQWEQGVQAVGYVRAGPADAAPERLDARWRYPVLQLRERVRDAILATLGATADGPADLRAAGVVAALVTGDQRAIDRVVYAKRVCLQLPPLSP